MTYKYCALFYLLFLSNIHSYGMEKPSTSNNPFSNICAQTQTFFAQQENKQTVGVLMLAAGTFCFVFGNRILSLVALGVSLGGVALLMHKRF